MFRALLIGVSEYRDATFPPMPFIEDDLAELSEALEQTGYEVDIHDRNATDSDGIQDAIESFIADAAPDAQLLIYLSGHGVHSDGMDYLVSSSAVHRVSRFPSGNCVPINCDAHISRSQAASVLVVVDACRDGVKVQTKSVSVSRWGDLQRDRALARKVAYFYACSPGQTAGYSGEGFSILSRAMSQALVQDKPATLADLLQTTQARMNVLFAPHGVQPHIARVLTDADQTQFLISPASVPPSEHAWIVAARNHKAWEVSGELLDDTVDLVGDIAISAGDDPWHDHHTFALRFSAKVGWLISKVLRVSELQLSPADAALLVAFPFLHQAYWARLAAETCESPDFERFRAGYPRLERRITASGDQNITRWLFHRWLITRPESYSAARLPELDGLPGEVFAPERLMQMFRAVRMDPTILDERRTIASSRDDEQTVHERLLGFLLTAAYKFAIDALDLPQVIVDHLGTGDPVNLTELATTLAKATWEPERRSRSLKAPYYHQAVHRALKLHAEAVNALLVQIERIGPDELANMPSHANAEQVYAVNDIAEGFRFHLDEDRVQELLMGEQLYGDPALAVRELYQNALDACRYREARTKYLQATGRPVAPWTGQITFNQGAEDGKAFLDCTDNGIGMGMRELTGLFANAGARFTTLPEYLEEEALWREEGIHLYPNSQFGIGVLSYFMLADEIKVTTCRLDRDGRPGRVLEAFISGPGTLSRVQRGAEGLTSGTTIRLYLRKKVSCVDILRRLLWVSDFAVSATDSTGSISWESGVLSEHAPIGSDPFQPDAKRRVTHIDKSDEPGAWWCDTTGGILADGMWSGQELFGMVMNLAGPHLPKLTVDRRNIVHYDAAEVDHRLSDSIPALLAEEKAVLSHEWLTQMVRARMPRLADQIFAKLIHSGRKRWPVNRHQVPLQIVGCFSADSTLFSDDDSRLTLFNPPEHLINWRLQSWVYAGAITGLTAAHKPITAYPSDHFLCAEKDFEKTPDPSYVSWLKTGQIPSALHIVHAAEGIGLTYPQVAEKLTLLGFKTQPIDNLPATSEPYDELLVSVEIPFRASLSYSHQVPLGHVISVASRIGVRPVDVVTRLAKFGYWLKKPTSMPEHVDSIDARLVTEALTSKPPWLSSDHPVHPGHVIYAAKTIGLPIAEVVGRLQACGFDTTYVADCPVPESLDLQFLKTTHSHGETWLDPRVPVAPGHVLHTARQFSLPPVEVAERLRILGHTVHEPVDWPSDPLSVDLIPLSATLTGTEFWLDPRLRVPVAHIALAAKRVQRSIDDILAELTVMNYQVPDRASIPDQLRANDAVILSANLDARNPWLRLDTAVSRTHTISASAKTMLSGLEVTRRLARFGYQVDDVRHLVKQFDDADVPLLRKNLDGLRQSLRDVTVAITKNEIFEAAGELRLTPRQVSARYIDLGFRAPDPATLPDVFSEDDRIMISASCNGGGPWLDVDKPVVLGHIVAAASALRRDLATVRDRLTEMGYAVPVPLPTTIDREDEILMSMQLNGSKPWLRSNTPVPAQHLIAIWASGRDVGEAARRLLKLGMRLPDGIELATA
ncbi:hypothetical protein DMH04_12635 [Kibdelosporangium aridum]|uniref:Caspase domain-containing protein n=1 Tax=Kibdelosporangium aridum TaxID=2030 RepID=A0A428ZEK3_KIBAR|nr:caspase family protein [Kibdelosporangium aridum]RSM86504.1 hypothetical protein DMH04_12635 [Kibdelosporangium aridum]